MDPTLPMMHLSCVFSLTLLINILVLTRLATILQKMLLFFCLRAQSEITWKTSLGQN